jgi:hypothetical protein
MLLLRHQFLAHHFLDSPEIILRIFHFILLFSSPKFMNSAGGQAFDIPGGKFNKGMKMLTKITELSPILPYPLSLMMPIFPSGDH